MNATPHQVAIKGTYIGRMEFVLFAKQSPRAAESFRLMCTGEAGVAPEGHEGAGKPYHFKVRAVPRQCRAAVPCGRCGRR